VAHRLLTEWVRPKQLPGQDIPISAIFGCCVFLPRKEWMGAPEPLGPTRKGYCSILIKTLRRWDHFYLASIAEALDLIGRVRNKESPRMALQMGFQNCTLLLSPDRRTSVIENLQRAKIPVGVQGDRPAVQISNFRVCGITNLPVVDASVFPYIPGFSS